MNRPWLYDEMALAIGLSVLSEHHAAIGERLGRSRREITHLLTRVRDSGLVMHWSEQITSAQRLDRDAARRVPRIAEPIEKPAPYVPRRFVPLPFSALPKPSATTKPLNDSALSQTSKGK